MEILTLETAEESQASGAYGNIGILVIPSSGDMRSASKRRGFASKFKRQLERLQNSFFK